LVRTTGGPGGYHFGLKNLKNEAEKPFSWQHSDRHADRFRISFSAAARSCFTKQEHLPLSLMNVDHGQVFGRGLMETAGIVSLHQLIPIDRRPSCWCHAGWRQSFAVIRQLG